MVHSEIRTKVIEILDSFGMSGAKAAEAMGVTYAVFRNKKNNSVGHVFNEKNFQDLVSFIKRKAEEL